MLTDSTRQLLDANMPSLKRQIFSPGLFTRRCVETLSFIEPGHETWTRKLQLSLPHDLGDQSSGARVVSVGLFDRIRYPSITVSETGEKPIVLLTREEHAYIMGSIWSYKFMVDRVDTVDWPQEARHLAKRFGRGLNAYFYEPQPEPIANQMRSRLRSYLTELVDHGMFREYVDFEGSPAEPIHTVFDRQIEEMTQSTQVLCWLPLDTEQPFRSLTVQYTKSDRVSLSWDGVSSSGKRPPKEKFRNRFLGGGYDETSENQWLRDLDPLSPVLVNYQPQMVGHCQSYYFQYQSPIGSRPIVAGWQADESERSQWMRGKHAMFAASLYLAHNDYTQSNFEMVDSLLGTPTAPIETANVNAPAIAGATATLSKPRQLEVQPDRKERPSIRMAIGATNEFLPTLGFAAFLAALYFAMRGAEIATPNSVASISNALGPTSILVFASVQLLAYVQYRRETRVAHSSYSYSTKIWSGAVLLVFLAVLSASSRPIEHLSNLADRTLGIAIAPATQHVVEQAVVCLGVGCALAGVAYVAMASLPRINLLRTRKGLESSGLLPKSECRDVRKECFTHMTVVAVPVSSAEPYRVFVRRLRKSAATIRFSSMALGATIFVGSMSVVLFV